MTRIAQVVSYIFHPVFVITYLYLLLIHVNPFLFSITDFKTKGLVFIMVLVLTVIFPLLTIALLKGTELISSFEMENRMERIGPLLATGVFYTWLFVNIKDNTIIPNAFSMLVLGATIGLFLAFFVNNFSKISLHTVGAGGLFAGAVIIRIFYSYEYMDVDTYILGSYRFHNDLWFAIIIFFAGATGTARLYLGVHKAYDVYGGYIVGIVSQIIAFRILF